MNIDEIKSKINFEYDISGRQEVFNSVVILLLININGAEHIIFQKRANHIRQGGEISLPGGKVEKSDKEIKDTALRETYEELGIPADKIEIIGRLDTVYAPMGAIIDVFAGTTDISFSEIKINEEVEEAFSVPVSFFAENLPEEYFVELSVEPEKINSDTGEKEVLFPAKELGLPEIYHKKWGKTKHKIYLYRTHNGIIWGITARIIYDFIERLKS